MAEREEIAEGTMGALAVEVWTEEVMGGPAEEEATAGFPAGAVRVGVGWEWVERGAATVGDTEE
jgi:hypothetical protein